MTLVNTDDIDKQLMEILNSIKTVTINQGTGIDGGSVFNAKQSLHQLINSEVKKALLKAHRANNQHDYDNETDEYIDEMLEENK